MIFDVPDLTFLAFQLGEISGRHPCFLFLKSRRDFQIVKIVTPGY